MAPPSVTATAPTTSVVTAGLEALYNVDDPIHNNVQLHIQLAGGQVLKSVYVSSLLLAVHSPRFKAEFTSSWQDASQAPATAAKAATGSTATPVEPDGSAAGAAPGRIAHPGRRVLHVSVEAAPDVAAVEACLHFMYSGRLPDGIQLQELLAVYRMADYLDMQSACTACAAWLGALAPARVSVEDALALGYGAALPEHLRTDGVKAVSLSVLLHHLGDVVLVMRSKALQAQWCGLPHGALLALLASDALASDSEDSVLAALSEWVDHNQPSKEQARELVQHVRCLQLSSAFFFTVLPQLPWLSGVVRYEEAMRLAAYARADANGRRIFGCTDSNDPTVKLPAAWMLTGPRPAGSSATEAVLSFSFTRAMVQGKLPASTKSASSKSWLDSAQAQFAHGLSISLKLCLDGTTGKLGVYAEPTPSAILGRQGVRFAWRLGLKVMVMRPPTGGTISQAFGDDGDGMGKGRGWEAFFTFPAARPITSMASWNELLLLDGQLRMELTVSASKDRVLPAGADGR